MTDENNRHLGAKPGSQRYTGTGRKFTEDRWEIFLQAFAKTGLVNKSAWAADVVPSTITQTRKKHPEFEEMFQLALSDYRESIEQEIHRRAIEGWDEPVYQKGELVGTVRRYSDRMLELKAKRHIAEYRDKVTVDQTVRGGVMVVPGQAADADAWEKEFGEKARGTTRHEPGADD